MHKPHLISIAVFLVGCATAGGMRNESAGRPEPGANDEVMRDDTPAQSGTLVSITLDANPEIHVGHEDDELDLHVRLTNEGDDPIDLSALAARLRVDGTRPVPFDLSGHGVTLLAPGQTIEWDARNLGVRLFETPGEHTLRLEIQNMMSPPVDVVVAE